MTKRVALLGCSHETNTFSPIPTTYEDFSDGNIWRGQEIEDGFRESHAVMAGFLLAADEYAFEPVPLMFTRAEPLGIIEQDALDRIVGELIEALATQGPWDGVLLALHGAAVAEREQDVDGWIVSSVRAAVGAGVPVGAVYDMHANVSRRMIDGCDIAVFYRTNPHLDALDRGLECGRLLARTLNGEIRPKQVLIKIPVIIGITRSDTSAEPMRSILADMEERLTMPGLLSASVTEGFPWADVPEMGMAAVAIADDDVDLASVEAKRLARRVWDRRFDMIDAVMSPEEAVRAASSALEGPVGILDVGDNIGGGAPGDSTILLELALQDHVGGVLLTLYDPEAVRQCGLSGVGTSLRLSIGGKLDATCYRALTVQGRVRRISDGRFEDTAATHEGYRFFNSGPTAVLELDNDVSVVLTSRRVGNVSQMQFRSLGIDPEAKRIIILKGVNAPRGAFSDICPALIMANTRGVTSVDFASFSYKNRPREIFPLQKNVEFRADRGTSPGGRQDSVDGVSEDKK